MSKLLEIKMPELSVEAKAELVSNNFPDFSKAFKAKLETYKYELLTDEDFAKAKSDVDELKQVEDKLNSVATAITEGSLDVKQVLDSISDLADEARQLRLKRQKLVKTRDVEINQEIVNKAFEAIDSKRKNKDHRVGIEASIKGKRSIKTKEAAAKDFVDSLNARIIESRKTIAEFVAEYESIAPDALELELKGENVVRGELERRVERIKADAEKKRLQEDHEKEQAKLKAEADRLKREAEEEKKKAILQASKPEEVKSEVINRPIPRGLDKTGNSKSGNHFDRRSEDRLPIDNQDDQLDEANRQLDIANEESNELLAYCELVVMQFATLKEARENLQHEENIARAFKFAQAVNIAFSELKGDVA